MKLIYLKRRGGKTTKAIELCKKTGAVLVVATYRLVEHLRKSGLSERQLITYQDFLDGSQRLRGLRWDIPGPRFIIDDVDMFLQTLASYGVVWGVTMSRPFTKRDCEKYGLPLDMVGRT